MRMKTAILSVALCLAWALPAAAQIDPGAVFEPGALKPRDSELKVSVGDTAPDFTLPSIAGGQVSLSDFRGKNVVLSFIPAAWTPVCSDQWPGYRIAEELFRERDAQLIGISVDNTPTLWAWTRAMGGVWFPVLSDFWPHGALAEKLGILRSDGVAERALFVIDKKGVIRAILVSDINKRPDMGWIMRELDKLQE